MSEPNINLCSQCGKNLLTDYHDYLLLDMFPENLSAIAHLVSPYTLYVGLADCLQQVKLSCLPCHVCTRKLVHGPDNASA